MEGVPLRFRDCSATPRTPAIAPGSPSQDQLDNRGIRILVRYSDPAPPALSIIIPMYNTSDWIDAAIQSALDQSLKNIEVVVVDDGSTDASLERALAFTDPRLTVLTQPNQGLSAARNSGVMVAKAELFGFLDGDDVWLEKKAERQVRVHQMLPDVGLTFSWSAYIDESGKRTGSCLVTNCNSPSARDLTRWNHVGNGSTAIVRRKCFEQVGLFDEQLRSCEDLDMWVRIAAKTRFSLRLVPEVLTEYRVREGSLSVKFDTFLRAAEMLRDRFAQGIPGLDARDAQRCYAQMLRISSRKAMADRQVSLSRKLLVRAIRASPMIALTDVRAMALIGLHLATFWLPESASYAAYRMVVTMAGKIISRLLKNKNAAAHRFPPAFASHPTGGVAPGIISLQREEGS